MHAYNYRLLLCLYSPFDTDTLRNLNVSVPSHMRIFPVRDGTLVRINFNQSRYVQTCTFKKLTCNR